MEAKKKEESQVDGGGKEGAWKEGALADGAFRVGACQIDIGQKPPGVEIKLEACPWPGEQEGQVQKVTLQVRSQEPVTFPPLNIFFRFPAIGIYCRWTPKINLFKALNLDWFCSFNYTNGFTGAPVECLMDHDGTSRICLGLSDTLHTTGLSAQVVEETAEYQVVVSLFEKGEVHGREYCLEARLDQRQLPYYEALKDMAAWWEGMEGNIPAFVPEKAKEPMYSTWYSFHQNLHPGQLLNQCQLAKKLGMATLLLDDGWQTDDGRRGYAYCGDWKPAATKIPDMADFARKVHQLGMKLMVWYSVPFMGERSENFRQFQDMLVDPEAKRKWHVLDPRYPKVREFIISLYEDALVRWDLDGFKLDFVDEFVVTPISGRENDPRRDLACLPDAAHLLMESLTQRLRAIKPDIMLEFRQTYNGPRMRSYGNIFRAVDCPLDPVANRMWVTDLRLIAGHTAVHSDMLMWNMADSRENAAKQLIAVLFSVPQVSVLLDQLPDGHLAMLRHYLSLWQAYKEAFLEGSFSPLDPVSRYPVILGMGKDQLACTVHANALVPVPRLCQQMLFVNGSGEGRLALEIPGKSGQGAQYEQRVWDCAGSILFQGLVDLKEGIQAFPVPVSGALELKAVP